MEGLGREVGGGGGPKGLILTLYVASGDPRDVLPRPPQPQSPQETKPCMKSQVLSLPRERTLPTLPLGPLPFLSLRAQLSVFHTLAGPQGTAMTPAGACSGGQSTDTERAEGVRLVLTCTDASGWGQE